jgi:hypothetical protein
MGSLMGSLAAMPYFNHAWIRAMLKESIDTIPYL